MKKSKIFFSDLAAGFSVVPENYAFHVIFRQIVPEALKCSGRVNHSDSVPLNDVLLQMIRIAAKMGSDRLICSIRKCFTSCVFVRFVKPSVGSVIWIHLHPMRPMPGYRIRVAARYGPFGRFLPFLCVVSFEKDTINNGCRTPVHLNRCYSLAFKENYVELRTDVKAGGWYVISGDYDYYPDTKKLVIVFNELKEEHNISVQFGGHVLGGGQLSDSKNSFDYQDSRSLHVTFSKSN